MGHLLFFFKATAIGPWVIIFHIFCAVAVFVYVVEWCLMGFMVV